MATKNEATAAQRPPTQVDAASLRRLMKALFHATGISEKASTTMAEALVDADLAGLPCSVLEKPPPRR